MALDERLWVEGNLSVDYGGELGVPGSQPFGLVFDPAEVAAAWRVDPTALSLSENTVAAQLRAAEPCEVACFPFAQHYLTSSFPTGAPIRDRAGLLARFTEVAQGS